MLSESTVHQFCVPATSTRLDRDGARPRCGERPTLLAEALRREIPGGEFVEPDGGYFLWVDLPEDIDVDELPARPPTAGSRS